MFTSLLYIFFIVLANVLAANWIVPLGLGLAVPAGVFAIAPLFTLRDAIHRKYGVWMPILLIIVGTSISYVSSILLGSDALGKVTIASIIAFFVSEISDTFIYHLIRKQSWMYKVIKSNLVSSFLDSIIFIGLAFGVAWNLILGQYLVKMIISVLVGFVLRKDKE